MSSDLVFGFTFKVIDQVSRSAPKIRKEIDLLVTSVDHLRRHSTQKIDAVSLVQFAGQANRAGAEARRLNQSSRSLATGLSILRRRSGGAASGVRLLHSAMSVLTAARLFSGVRRSVTGLSRALLDAIKIGADFDRQLAFSGQVMGASTKETAMLREEAKRLGATTSFTARDAARGFLVLGQAGYRARDSINLLAPSVYLAGAGMVSLEKATQVTSDAIKVFKFGTEDAGKVTNILTAGFTSSSQSLLQLQDGLRQAGPVAAAAGRSLEETVAVLGLFANQGFRGAKGGVALRNILAQVQTPNKNLTRALQFLNLSMKDLNPSTNSLATIFKRLEPLAARADLTFQLFGKRTAPAFLSAVKAGSGALTEIEQKMGSAKTAAAIYAKLMDTVAGRTDIFKSALEALKIELFDAIKPVVKKDLADATGLINGIMRAVQRGAPLVRAVFGAIGDTFRFTLRVVQEVFGSIGGSFMQLSRAGKMTRQAINDVMGPMLLSVTVLKLQVFGFIEGFIKGLKKGWDQASAALAPFIVGLWRVIIIAGELSGFFQKGEDGVEKFGKILGWAIGVFAVFGVAKLALIIPNFIIGSSVAMASGLKSIAMAIWTFFVPAQVAATAATGATTTSLLAGTWAAKVFWVSLGVFALVGGIVAGAAYLIYKYWNPIKAFFGTLWQPIAEMAKWSMEYMGLLWDQFTGGLAGNWKAFTEFFIGAWRLGVQFVSEIFDGIVNKFMSIMSKIPYLKKAVGAWSAARQKDVEAARKKREQTSLASAFVNKAKPKPETSAALLALEKKKPMMTAIPKMPTGGINTDVSKFKMPSTPKTSAFVSPSANPVQAQAQARIGAQSNRVDNSKVRTVNHFNFSKGAITLNGTDIKDAEGFARALLPVMERLRLDEERRGA